MKVATFPYILFVILLSRVERICFRTCWNTKHLKQQIMV